MNIVINDGSDMRDFFWRQFGLENRSIIFHLMDAGDDFPHIGSGLISDVNDLPDTDTLYEIGYEHDDDEELSIHAVESYSIGDGESDNADLDECATLAQMLVCYPTLFDDFIRDFAECLSEIIPVYSVANPAYDND